MDISELESLGLCRSVSLPAELKKLSPGTKALILALLRAGEDGLPRKALKPFLALDENSLLDLEMKSMVHWLRDNRGRESHVCLTWKGIEAGEALARVRENQAHSSWLTRTKAKPATDHAPRDSDIGALDEEGGISPDVANTPISPAARPADAPAPRE